MSASPSRSLVVDLVGVLACVDEWARVQPSAIPLEFIRQGESRVAATVGGRQGVLAVVAAGGPLPADFDVLLVVGGPDELTAALAALGSQRIHLLTLPSSPALVEAAVRSGLHAAGDRTRACMVDQLLGVGLALYAKRDPSEVLQQILHEARVMVGADAGSLYVVEDDGRRLCFKYAENESIEANFSEFTLPITDASVVGACVQSGKAINLADLYTPEGRKAHGRSFSHDRRFDERTGYQTRSMLTVPMRPPGGEVSGVIQLINARRGGCSGVDPRGAAIEVDRLLSPADFDREVIPFDEEAERLCAALAAQGAVALESARLYEEVRNLFEGFVRASVTAIEQRDPTTSGHSQRVADLTVALAQHVDGLGDGPFAAQTFSRDQLRELEYAALLHDFGKVGVREEVLVKAKKLHPLEYELVMARFEHLRMSIQIDALRRMTVSGHIGGPGQAAGELALARRLAEVDEWIALVRAANEPSVLDSACSDRLVELTGRTYEDSRGGVQRLLADSEIEALLVQRGSLTPGERMEIENHVNHTYNFLMKIPWGKMFAGVPDIAGKHHEYLDGTGYPRKVPGPRISVQTRMMTISDIFDALTASDRPYKKAVPVPTAIHILHDEAARGKVDPALLEVFIGARVFERIGLVL